jgi:hypothetical protein
MFAGIFLLLARIRNRLPDRKQFWPVLSTVVFIVFSWTIYRALYQIPSWLYYLTLLDIFPLFAYILGYALLESLLVSAFLAAYCLILPERWMKKYFAAQGFVLAIFLAFLFYLLRSEFAAIQKLATWQMAAILPGLVLFMALLILLLARLMDRFPKLVRWLEGIGNRLTIFGYIYIPFGILGSLVVLIRNLI